MELESIMKKTMGEWRNKNGGIGEEVKMEASWDVNNQKGMLRIGMELSKNVEQRKMP